MKKMLHLEIIKAYEDHFMKLAALIDTIKESSFYESLLIEWLDELEKLASDNNDRIAPDIAIIKGKILTYVPDNQGRPSTSSSEKRKLKKQYTVNCLADVKCVADSFLQHSRTLIQETDVLCYKLASVANEKGYIQKNHWDTQSVITAIRNDNELLPAWVNVVGTVGIHNAILIFENAIQEVI